MPPGQGKPAHPSRHEGEIVYLVVNAPSALLIEPLLVADFVLLTEHDADPFGARKNAVIQGGPVALMAHRLDNAGLYHRTFDDRNDAETAACAAKVRCCRYTIVGELSVPYTAPVLGNVYDDDDLDASGWGDDEDGDDLAW